MAKSTDGPSPWEQYVFDKFSALAVPVWKGSRGLQLLDVLVHRTENPSDAAKGRKPPVLQQIRNFFTLCALRRGEDDDDDLAHIDILKEALKNFNRKENDDVGDEPDEEPIFFREHLGTSKDTVGAKSKTMASLLECFGFHKNSSEVLTITIEEGLLRSVDKQGASFNDAIDVWKANMEIIAKYLGAPSEDSEHVDLFLVTDVLCADNIKIEDKKSRSGGASAQMSGPVVAAALGLPPSIPATSVNLGEASRESTSDMDSGLIAKETTFAIRTVRLRCERSTGKVVHIDTTGGSEHPGGKVRGSTDCKFLADPVLDRVYNMGDLFVNVSNDPGECSYIPLEIALDDAALASAEEDQVSDRDSED